MRPLQQTRFRNGECLLQFRFLRPWALVSPPFGGSLPSDSVQIGTKRSALWLESVGPIPYLDESLLRDVLGCLRIADDLANESLQPWRILAVERVE